MSGKKSAVVAKTGAHAGQARPSNGGEAWQWTDALATARPGSQYRIAQILLSLVRARCGELGCEIGQLFTCLANRGGKVTLLRSDGRKVLVEGELAWYVRTELYAPSPQPH